MIIYEYYENTATIAGRANYSFGERGQIDDGLGSKFANSGNREIVRHVKKLLGLTGVKCRKEAYSDMTVLRPIGSNKVVFITYD